EELDRGNHVVILHGTDTMTYTASALAFMLERQSRSVILTGSQRSSDRPSSDAFENISSSIMFTALNAGEVCISMHGSISDFSGRLMRGTRSRKMHTSRRDAIRPVDGRYLARIEDGVAIKEAEFRSTGEDSVLIPKMDSRAAILYFYPGMDPGIFETIAQKNDAIVIMGTGLGHVSESIISEVRKAHGSGVHIVMTSQCIAGNTNLNVYSTGRELKAAGAISAGDILPEVALTKAMFLLANHSDEFEKLMQIPMRGEIEERLRIE
ncbi:MAG: Glu-tRNA(Gln) amidotransferase subunit GatD, partial [Candidatus Thermoplasmatota archaeon]|nr:Glu-tRNA(Gln) amidotransferase subunit GatD [Candidatus Thermoplasmatota archaeon]